jgi:hypothetical protein
MIGIRRGDKPFPEGIFSDSREIAAKPIIFGSKEPCKRKPSKATAPIQGKTNPAPVDLAVDRRRILAL